MPQTTQDMSQMTQDMSQTMPAMSLIILPMPQNELMTS